MSVDKIAQNLLDAYASDPDGFMRDGCRGYGLDNVQAMAVCETLEWRPDGGSSYWDDRTNSWINDTGEEGVVSEDETHWLRFLGLEWTFIDQFAGHDGRAPYMARKMWRDDHGMTNSKYEYTGKIRRVASLKTHSGSDAEYVPEAYIRSQIEMLKNQDDAVRLEAAYQLGGVGAAAKAAIPALIDALRNEINRDVIGYMGYALGRMGSAAVPALKGVLENKGESAWLRKRAATILGGIGFNNSDAKSAVIISLVKALEDEDRYVRETAADHLGKLGCSASMEAVKALVDALKDTDKYVREAAAGALGKSGVKTEEVVCALSSLLFNDYDNVRTTAAGALGWIGVEGVEAKPAIPLLIAILEGDESTSLQSMAIYSLGRIGRGSPEAVTAISAALFAELPDCMFDEEVEKELNRRTPELWCEYDEWNFDEGGGYSTWVVYALDALRNLGKQGCAPLLRAAKEHPYRGARQVSAAYFNEMCG